MKLGADLLLRTKIISPIKLARTHIMTKDSTAKNVFIASPLGFAESTRDFMKVIEDVITNAGYTPVNPWRLNPGVPSKPDVISPNKLSVEDRRIASENKQALDKSNFVVAILDGPDVDSGTASEIGYANAKGKIIVGYRGDFRRSGECEGCVVNLQVQYWIEESGGKVTRSIDELHTVIISSFGRSAIERKPSLQ